ncbi:hypothetical protein FB567DRAFT_238065 [Paraphoma chrysanthemicola]|uniref:Uncharacterized protein n=1 Tax=Paraphoma chrysanthemicola TaxID=798071 RepID=A0A8K0W2W6_9PLEO|nr:hypothetical protein FB567DRAFT_238065 [Paraphoma chrysanthemicola]
MLCIYDYEAEFVCAHSFKVYIPIWHEDTGMKSLPRNRRYKLTEYPTMKKSFFAPPNLITRLTNLILLGLIPLSILAAFLIVHMADGDAISSWRISPAVLLALISSLVNICLGTVLSFGVAVRWWCAVSRERGTTLKSLHLIWERGAGVGLWSALKIGKDARRVALAALVVAGVKFGANPLLQNALATNRVDVVDKMNMTIGMADRIPEGLLARRTNGEELDGMSTSLRPYGARVLRNWYFNMTAYNFPRNISNIEDWERTCPRNSTDGCGGYACPAGSICKTMIPSAGIKFDCESSNTTVGLREYFGNPVLNISIARATPPNDSALMLRTSHLGEVDDLCTGIIVSNTCLIRAALVQIPITVEWSAIAAHSMPIPQSTYESEGDHADAQNGTKAGPLSTMGFAIGGFFRTLAILEDLNTVSSYNAVARVFWNPREHPDDCGHEYIEPTQFVSHAMQEFMAQAAIVAARVSGGNFYQNVTVDRITPTTIYKADFWYLAGALLVIFAGLASVVTLLWGWWRLDRWNITLSPLETSKAFGAPLLISDRDSDEADEILKDKGRIMVRYDGMAIAPDLNGGRADAELQLLRTRSPW